MTDDLVQFLRDRYDEEVAEAGKLDDADDWEMKSWQVRRDETGAWDSYAYLRITKARVLAEVDAKRQLINWGLRWPLRPHPPSSVDGVLERLALPYVSHPHYREEWKP